MAGPGKYSTRNFLQNNRDFSKTLYQKQPTSTPIFSLVSVAKAIPLKKFVQNSLRKFSILSSVNKSVGTVDSPQAFLCKFVKVFLWTVVRKKLWSLQNFCSTISDIFRKNFDYHKLRCERKSCVREYSTATCFLTFFSIWVFFHKHSRFIG